MKTLYALILACLSLQACSEQPQTTAVSTDISQYLTADQDGLPIIGDPDITATVPAIKPIDGAGFEGTSRDSAATPWVASPDVRDAIDAWIGNYDTTGTVTTAASKSLDDDVWAEFWLGDADTTGAVTAAAKKPIEDDVWVEFWLGGNAAEAP
jgi:hypothetical protein